MKKIIYFINTTVVFVILALVSSCRKMLEIPSNAPGQLVTGQVFSDSSTAVNGVVGIYNFGFASDGPLSLYMTLYPSLSADDLTSIVHTDFSNNALLSGSSSNPAGGSTGMIWNGFYNNTLIYQANAAIEGITASSALSPALKDQLIGECEVVRALSYFYLVNLYGPAPVVTTTDYLVNNKLPRSSADSVYVQIIKDLSDASRRLGINYPSSGHARPNRYTAMALLSRVYLYREEWNLARSTADAIINSGNYSLETLDNVYVIGNQEAIWQAVSVGYYGYETPEGQAFLPFDPSIIPQNYLTSYLVNAFETDDQRMEHWLAFNTVDGQKYYYPYKYRNRQTVQVDGRVEGEVIVRLAEQYLIRAEANIQLGNLTEGANDIDMIRSRAGLPNTTAATKEDLLTAIAHERQTELFCEWGHRWLDLKRTDQVNAVLSQEKGNRWPADGHAALYPIPYDQLKLNSGWKQNAGY